MLLPITMITTYFVVYYLIPKYLLIKKYKTFGLYSFYTFVFSTYLILMAIFASYVFLSNFELKTMPPMSRNYVFILILVYLIVFMGSLISLIGHNFKTQSYTNELQNKLLETQLQIKDQELQYLKKQIHPHFLFNTLNTIYGFALKQSTDTPEIILKLSNLLDYILYQVNKPSVGLVEEVSHIKEYIDLERIRFQETLKVDFTSEEIHSDIQIAPMLLIPFVENAFKHGDLIDDFLHIELEIKTDGNGLDFNIKNSVKENYQEKTKNGIGLENIKKRLDILYVNNYSLDINRENNWYKVRLKIENLKPI
jgi:two-component system LytT family sensor kinase